jgi:phosphinothricin acetyltransferase
MAVIRASAAAGRRQMVAVIGDSANRGSIRLHEKAGFRLVGVLKDVGFKFDRFLDTVIMQRSLGDDEPMIG